MGLKDKPKTWAGMTLRNIHTGALYKVEYAFMSHVQLAPLPNGEPCGGRLFWDYRNVRKHFKETDDKNGYNI